MTAAVVLAAGAGTRFGTEPKLLAELAGRPVLEHALHAVCAVKQIERVIVVLGANEAAIRRQVRFGRAEPIHCEPWRDGLSASLQVGVAALKSARRVLVVLGDAPEITSELIERLLAAASHARATYDGRPGHPVLLAGPSLSSVAELRGDTGARSLLHGALAIECGDLTLGRDVDTAADLAAIRGGASVARQRESGRVPDRRDARLLHTR